MHRLTRLVRSIHDSPKILVSLFLMGYPFTVYLAHDHLDGRQLLAGLLGLFGLRALITVWLFRRHVAKQLSLAFACMFASAFLLYSDIDIHMTWLRFYPAFLDFLVAAVFFGSLFSSRPLVERFARIIYPDLPASGVAYTRRVTEIWSLSMMLITLVSLGTALWGSLRVWSLFNGLIVYIVMGLIFACEYAVRCRVKSQWETS